MANSRQQDRKEEKEPESKETTRANAHAKAAANAKQLQNAMASLIYQAETEARERVIHKEKHLLRMAAPEALKAAAANSAAKKAAAKAKHELGEIKKIEAKEVKEEDAELIKLRAVANEKKLKAQRASEKEREAKRAATEIKEEKKEEKKGEISEEKKKADDEKKAEIKETAKIAKKTTNALREIAAAAQSAVEAKEAAIEAEKIAQRLGREAKEAKEGPNGVIAGKAARAKKAAEETAKEARKAMAAAKMAAQEYNEEPPIIHPLTAYGYGTPGGGEFKKLIDNLQTAANDLANDITPDEKKEVKNEEEKKEKESEKKEEEKKEEKENKHEEKHKEKDKKEAEIKHEAKVESKAAAEFKKLFSDFESLVRDAQNGWMMGKPVEPGVLKDEAKKLLAKCESNELKAQGVNPEKLERIKEQLADFPANVDRAVENWQRRAKERVDSNESMIIHRKMLTAEIEFAKTANRVDAAKAFELKRELGGCDIFRMTPADLKRLQGDKSSDFKEFNRLPFTTEDPASTRAYVLIQDAKDRPITSVAYVNKTTKEITVMLLDPDKGKKLEAELTEMRGRVRLYSSEEGEEFAWRSTLKVPAELSALDGGPENSARMKPHHEKWIATIIGQRPDWKKTLPCAYGDPDGEMARRVREEKECLELCGGDQVKAEQMARDKALERLEKFKDKPMEYDVGGDVFRVHRKKDEDGKLFFSVEYSGEKSKYLHGSNAMAMASMVDLCYKHDPLRSVELDCEPLVGDKGNQPRKVLIKVEQQLEQAIAHAKKLANGNPPVYIGIEIGENAKAVLSALGSDKGLEHEAQMLFERWNTEIAKKHQDTQQKATQRYTASKEGELGALLASSPDRGGDLEKLALELKIALKTKGDLPADENKKFGEVSEEVQKLDARVRQFGLLNQSINDQMRALEKELEKPEIKKSPTDLGGIAERLEGLIANRKALESDIAKFADNKKGVAANYYGWVNQPEVARVLGVDRSARGKPPIPDGKTEKEARTADPDLEEKFKVYEKTEAYYKLVDQTAKAEFNASDILKKNKESEKDVISLKSKIDGLQEALKQQALAGPEAPAEVQRPRMS